jgi:hypothetical protein
MWLSSYSTSTEVLCLSLEVCDNSSQTSDVLIFMCGILQSVINHLEWWVVQICMLLLVIHLLCSHILWPSLTYASRWICNHYIQLSFSIGTMSHAIPSLQLYYDRQGKLLDSHCIAQMIKSFALTLPTMDGKITKIIMLTCKIFACTRCSWIFFLSNLSSILRLMSFHLLMKSIHLPFDDLFTKVFTALLPTLCS